MPRPVRGFRCILLLALLGLVLGGIHSASQAASPQGGPRGGETHAQSQFVSSFDDAWVGYPAPSVVSQIRAIVPYAGGVVMGGDGSFYGTTTCRNLALWDGVGWQALGNGVPSWVYSLSVYGSSLVACGFGGSVSGGEMPAVYLWDGATWTTIGNANGHVYASAVIGTDLYVGGSFLSINGVPASRIARWDGSTWHAVGPGMSGNVLALVAHGGVLVAGGVVSPYQGVAQWDGVNWSNLGAGLQNGAGPGTTSSLCSDGITLYASGTFDSSGGTPVTRVVAWNGVSWSGLAGATQSSPEMGIYGGFPVATVSIANVPRPQVWDGSAWQAFNQPNVDPQAYGLDGSNLYVGGYNSTGWGTNPVTINPIHRFDGASWTPVYQPWAPGMKGIASGAGAAEVVGGSLYVGGNTQYFGAEDHFVQSVGCARWDGSNWNAAGAGGPVQDLALWQDSLVAAVAGSVRVWNGTNWRTLTTGTGSAYPFSDWPDGLAACGDDLLMFGVESAGPTVLNGVGRWDGYGWGPLGGGVSPYWSARTATRWGSQIVLGGSFASAGGVPARRIAWWDGVAYHELGGGADGVVWSMLEFEGDLILAGSFTEVGGDSIRGVARWNGSSWSAMGSRAKSIDRLRMHGGTLYAIGSFLDDEGVPLNEVARWTGTEWQRLGWVGNEWLPPGAGNPAADFAFLGEDLYLVGGFNEFSGHAARGFAKLPNVSTLGVTPPTRAGASLALAPSPNPSPGSVRFTVTLPAAGRARLVIHDVSGREVARLLDGPRAAGTFSLAWDERAAPGLYFAMLEVAGERATTRVVRLK